MIAATLGLPPERAVLAAALEGLVRANQLYLRTHPATPLLRLAGVRYRREPAGVEEWLTIPRVMRRGVGDCEDLAAWLAAELRERKGTAARVDVIRTGPHTYHAIVRLPDGRVLDPSRALGMRRRRRNHAPSRVPLAARARRP